MAHLLISQGGERFTYSHEFSHILLQNMEIVLKEKDGMNSACGGIGMTIQRKQLRGLIDSSAYDYIHRPEELNNYEYTMWYKKEYTSFKQLNAKSTTTKSCKFAKGLKVKAKSIATLRDEHIQSFPSLILPQTYATWSH